MTTPTLALGVSAAGAQTVADLAAAVGTLKNNLAGLAAVAGGGVPNLDALVKEFREMRQELGATLQGLRTDLASGMEKAFSAAAQKAKQGADQLENEVKKGSARVRVAAKGIALGDGISASISGQGLGSLPAVTKLVSEIKAGSVAVNAAAEDQQKQLFAWQAKLMVGSAAIAETQRVAAEKEENARLGYRIKLMTGSAKLAEAQQQAAAKEDASKLAYRIRMMVGSQQIATSLEQAAAREANARMGWVAKLQLGSMKIMEAQQKAAEKEENAKLAYRIKLMAGSAKIAETQAETARKELEAAAKKAAAIDLASRTVEAAYTAADTKGQLRAQIRARAQLDRGIDFGTVSGRFGNAAALGAMTAPSLGSLKEDLEKLGGSSSKVMPRFTKELNDAHSAARGLASGFGAMWLTWGNMAPLLAGAALSHGFVQAVKMGAEVQNTFQIIRNLSQETDGAVAGLNAQMMELARTGPFGPREIADAMKTLSLAGLDAGKVASSIKDVLNFAVAGDTSIEKAADVMTSVATAFGVSAEGYNYVGDVIAKTAAVSKASVDSIGESFKTASVVNAQYGASLEDVGVGIALLSNVGIKGTAAGTALRNMYVDILGRTPKVQKAFEALGLSATFAFDKSTGKAKSLIEIFTQLDGALSKYDKVSQTRALQDIFSERGGKEAIAVLDALRQKAKESGSTVGTELQRMIREINAAEGFMATASAKMALTPLNQMKSTVASLQATLVGTFDSLQPYIAATAEKLKSVFNSQEFQTGVRNMVVVVGELTRFIVEHSGALTTMFALWASFKLANGISALIQGMALSIYSLGTAAKSAATSMGLLAATQATTTAATAAGAAATAGKAASLAGLLGVFGRFVPYLGAAIIAWQGYSMWTDSASKANKDYTGESHTALIKALDAEYKRLKDINEARRQGITLDQLQRQQAIKAAQGDLNFPVEAARSKLLELQAQRSGVSDGNATALRLDALIKKQQTEIARQESLADARKLELQVKANQVANESREIKEAELKAIADREKARLAGALNYKLPGRGEDGAGAGGLPVVKDNELTTLEATLRQRESALKTTYDNEIKELEANHRNKLISEGTYQARVLKLTLDYEAQAKEATTSSMAEMQRARDEEAARLAKVYKGDNLKQALENLRNTFNRIIGGANTNLTNLTSNTMLRQKLSVIELDGEVKKLVQSNEDYWTKAMAGAQKEEALTQTRIASLSMTEEQRAAMEASTRVGEQHAQHVDKLRRDYDEAVKELSDFNDELQRTGVTGQEADAKAASLTNQIAALAAAIKLSEGNIGQLQERAAGNASLEVQARKYRQFADNFSGQLADAIVNAGEDGGESLRRVLENELIKKPFKMVIEALLKPVTEQMSKGLFSLVEAILNGMNGGSVGVPSTTGGGVITDSIPTVVGGVASADGGGYTGNGPRSGGLDHKGGFLALLHPQESIVDHSQGQGFGGKTQIVINNYGNDKASAQETVDSRGNRRIEVTVGEMVAGELRRPGSSAHQANRQAFNTRPSLVGR
jgi:TP901 family phage tail tape measure protein